MSLPEISRRCVSCGAAVRLGARFCPQCGRGFDDAGKEPSHAAGSDAPVSSSASGGEADDGIESLAARLSAGLAGVDMTPKTRDIEAGRDALAQTRDGYMPAREDESAPGQERVETRGDVGAASVSQSAGRTAQGASRAARVREGARARVEHTKVRAVKMRDEALVALEETPDDSGLRFVVVAAALFLLFLIFLFFSISILR